MGGEQGAIGATIHWESMCSKTVDVERFCLALYQERVGFRIGRSVGVLNVQPTEFRICDKREVKKALEDGRSSFVISHRPSLFEHSTRVVEYMVRSSPYSYLTANDLCISAPNKQRWSEGRRVLPKVRPGFTRMPEVRRLLSSLR